MSLPDRWNRRIKKSSGCWIWTGARDPAGYGNTYLDGKYVKAHRAVYEALVGPIPHGFQIDHLCRNTSCVNPAHLEPVTQRVNLLRGQTIPARNAAKTHCVHGHAFDEANTYIDPKTGGRLCRACRKESDARRHSASRSKESV